MKAMCKQALECKTNEEEEGAKTDGELLEEENWG